MNLKKIILGTALVLATAGCKPLGSEGTLYGSYEGNKVEVRVNNRGTRVLMEAKDPLGVGYTNHLAGMDYGSDGIFEEIAIDGIGISKRRAIRAVPHADSLYKYANNDSLNKISTAVLKQNGVIQ